MKRSLIALSIFLSSCAATFPVKEAFIVDVTNQVCAKYEIYDLEEIKFRLVAELPLAAKGPCDRLWGVKRQDVNPLLNYIRRAIDEKKRDK